MNARFAVLLVALAFVVPFRGAEAAQLTASPISHGAGFSSVTCHVINAGTKDVVIESIGIDVVENLVSYGNTSNGCTGSPPYILSPGQGCSRRMVDASFCNQPNSCYCAVEVSKGAKTLRGTMVGTVTGSTTVMTSELRIK